MMKSPPGYFIFTYTFTAISDDNFKLKIAVKTIKKKIFIYRLNYLRIRTKYTNPSNEKQDL